MGKSPFFPEMFQVKYLESIGRLYSKKIINYLKDGRREWEVELLISDSKRRV